MTTQTDADLIRELEFAASALVESGWGQQAVHVRRAAARLSELTQRGEVVVTRANGAIVAVTRQDEEGRILSLIAEAEQPAPQRSVDAAALAAQIMSDCGCSTDNERLLERVTQRIAAHTEQPAPLALSAEDAQAWDARVRALKAVVLRYGPDSLTRGESSVLAVDALLRKRSAAHDLLAALKELLADIQDYQRINHLGGENNHSQVIARAAIKRAEEGK